MAEHEEPPGLVIEYSIDAGATWTHGRTVAGWVRADPAQLALQRAAVREQARGDHGDVERVITRVLADDDPRGVLNQPPAGASPDLPPPAAVTIGDLLSDDPGMSVTVRATPETLLAIFTAMQDDVAAELAARGVVPVSVVYGELDGDTATAVQELSDLARELGCRSYRGGNDYVTWLFTGTDARDAALRFTARADQLAESWWIVTPTFRPVYRH